MRWWWLSFYDRPADRFLGIALVPGEDVSAALATARDLGLDPGGECSGVLLPGQPNIGYCGRLILHPEAQVLADMTPEELCR